MSAAHGAYVYIVFTGALKSIYLKHFNSCPKSSTLREYVQDNLEKLGFFVLNWDKINLLPKE